MAKCIRVSAFKGGWEYDIDTREESLFPDAEVLRFRNWQAEAFACLGGHKYRIVNAPMGAGKSLLMAAFGEDDRIRDPQVQVKVVIAVPQNAIGEVYDERFTYEIEGEKHEIRPMVLCGEKNNTTMLRNFLSERKVQHSDYRSIVCTHSALRRFFDSCNVKERKKLFRHVRLWIDESHHIMFQEFEDKKTEMNKLARVVRFFLRHNLSVSLATATFFRGDGNGLVPQKYKSRFERYSLAFDKYITECLHLRSFAYDFMFFKDTYCKCIRELFQADPSEKTIIYIPHPNSDYAELEKAEAVQEILKAISPESVEYVDDGECPHYLCRVGDKTLRVIDLVKVHGRDVKVKFIKDDYTQAKEEGCEPATDVIIALGVYKEGANYPPLSRVIIVGTRMSSVELIQMVGRAFRDYPGKRHVCVYQLLREQLKWGYENDKEFRVMLNNNLKVLLISMMMEEMFFPVIVKRKHDKGGTLAVSNSRDLWMECYGDKNFEVRRQILMEILRSIPDGLSISDQWETFERVAFSRLAKDAVDFELRDRMVDQLKAMLARRTQSLKLGHVDVGHIDVDCLDDVSPFGWLMSYSSKVFEVDTFHELRTKMYGEDYWTEDEMLQRLKDWMLSVGVLPLKDSDDPEERELADFRFKLSRREGVQEAVHGRWSK